MNNKVAYLLQKYPSTEWSGPAWYSIRTDDEGYPYSFVLEYFIPLDLGSSGHTEWDGDDFCKVLPSILEKHPKIGKCIQGNIHSHHTMGAFFSGTDENHLTDSVNKTFYPSLVVASGGKAKFAFAFSYLDQYNISHIIEILEEDIEVTNPKPKDEWVLETANLKKPVNTITTIPGRYLGYQGTFDGWENEYNPHTKHHNNLIGYNKIIDKYDEGKLNFSQVETKLKKINLDLEGNPIGK